MRHRADGLAAALERLGAGAGRPLRLGTPCAGFEAPVFALRALGVRFEHAFAADVAPHAAAFGLNLRRALCQEGLHSGKSLLGQNGDLLRLKLSEVPSVDVLVAGPPCPPWSMQGRREGQADARAQVFWRVIDLIGELALREPGEALQCFVLENVKGIMSEDAHKRRGIDEVWDRLKRSLGSAFKLQVLHLNSCDYSLPQNRPRVYVVGVRQALLCRGRGHCKPRPHPPAPPFAEWVVPAEHAPPGLFEVPDRLREKKAKWDQQLEALDQEAQRCRRGWGWATACADIERDVDKTWAAKVRKDGYVGTFTTQFSLWFWVRRGAPGLLHGREAGLNACEQAAPLVSEAEQRFLMPVEALAMQGFPVNDPLLAQALRGLTDAEVLLGAGNAMSVPVVGAVLAELLARARLGTAATVPRPLACSDDDCDSVEEPDSATSFATPAPKRARLAVTAGPLKPLASPALGGHSCATVLVRLT